VNFCRAAGASEAFSGFATLWMDPNWTRVLREIVYWYAEANMNAGAIEGGMPIGKSTPTRRSIGSRLTGEFGSF
jgi:hypothetical protein